MTGGVEDRANAGFEEDRFVEKWTDRYKFDKTDVHTKLFCAASDWMDRAVKAEAERDAALKALAKIAAFPPTFTAKGYHGPTWRCFHCGHAWVEGKDQEHHSPNCAYVIAREVLAKGGKSG